MWHIGTDAEASGFLNDLYHCAAIEQAGHARLLALFRLGFRYPSDILERCAGDLTGWEMVDAEGVPHDPARVAR